LDIFSGFGMDVFMIFTTSKNDQMIVLYTRIKRDHHLKKTFLEEYIKILKDFDTVYDERYIFKPLTD
jgi:putative transposase